MHRKDKSGRGLAERIRVSRRRYSHPILKNYRGAIESTPINYAPRQRIIKPNT